MNLQQVSRLQEGEHRVAPSLYLRITNAGRTRKWIFRKRVAGRLVTRVLGSMAEMSFKQARRMAVVMAGDLVGEKVAEELVDDADQQAVTDETFDAFVAAGVHASRRHTFSSVYMPAIEARRYAARWKNAKHADQWVNTVKTYALKKLGNLDVREITTEHVIDVLKPIWTEKPETASRLRARLEIIFAFCIRKGWMTSNPASWKGNLEFDLPMVSKVKFVHHHEAPTLSELQGVLPELVRTVSGRSVIFGALTATRVQEFVLAQWNEIDLESRLWSVPPERRKDGVHAPFEVPLSEQAVALLRSLPRKGPYVFVGGKRAHLSLETPRLLLRRIIERPVTMHGCRSTFRDWCAEQGADPIVAEKCLMHSVGTKVFQAYQRSTLLDRRAELMQRWADAFVSVKHLTEGLEANDLRNSIRFVLFPKGTKGTRGRL